LIPALRHLRRRPGFTAVALTIIALASGAALALAALLEYLAFRPLPVRAPHELTAISSVNERGQEMALPFGSLTALAGVPGLSTLAGYTGTGAVIVETTAGPTVATVDAVTANYFDMLGVLPQLGRFLQDADAGMARQPVHPPGRPTSRAEPQRTSNLEPWIPNPEPRTPASEPRAATRAASLTS
jgi:hypothetical protein